MRTRRDPASVWFGVAVLAFAAIAGCRGRGCGADERERSDDSRAHKTSRGPNLVEVCMTGVRAVTERGGRCDGAEWWGSVDRAVEQLRPACRALVSAPGVRFDRERTARCVAAYAKLPCDAPEPEDCKSGGTLDDGSPCAFTPQCKWGSTCPLGADTVCGTCTPLSREGEACGPGCRDGLSCVAGLCATPPKNGRACLFSGDCPRRSYCQTTTPSDGGTSPTEAKGTCQPLLGEGASCTGRFDCAPRWKCEGGRCVARAAPRSPGAACDDPLDCLDFSCVAHKCERLAEEAEACPTMADWDHPPCAASLVCVKGRCVLLDASKCL